MPKIEIEVDQVLTCAVAIEADPGDRLIVMNGLVVGVIERRIKPPPIDEPPAPAPTRAPRVLPPAKENLKSEVIEVLREHGPMTTTQIGRLFNGRPPLRGVVADLRQRGLIEPTDPTVRYPAYRLIG